jgi:hypothetical protein
MKLLVPVQLLLCLVCAVQQASSFLDDKLTFP